MSKKRIIDGGPKIRNGSLIGQGGKRVVKVDGLYEKGAIAVGKGPKNPTNDQKPQGPTP